MGCSICLEVFGDGDKKPVTLHCGHLFHQVCIQTWLDSQQRQRCALCSQPADVNAIKTLYPGEIYDLDYLVARREVDGQRWAAELMGMTSEQAAALLDDLLDWQQSMQMYVLGILGVSITPVTVAGSRVHGLVETRVMNPAVQTDLKRAMDSLQKAIAILQKQCEQMQYRQAKYDKRFEHLKQHGAKQARRSADVERMAAKVTEREKACIAREDEVGRMRAILFSEQATLADEQAISRGEVEKARESARRHAEEAIKARIEARQTVAAKEDETQARLADMMRRCEEAESRQREAELERDAHKAKEHSMAEQMKRWARKAKESRAEADEEKRKRKEEALQHRKELEALRKRATSGATLSSPPRCSMTGTPATTARRRNSSVQDEESENVSPRWKSLALSESGADESLSLGIIGGPFATQHRARDNRVLTDHLVGTEDNLGDDDDNDDDDELPMPGMPSRKFRRTDSNGSGSQNMQGRLAFSRVHSSDAVEGRTDQNQNGNPPVGRRGATAEGKGGSNQGLITSVLDRRSGLIMGPRHKVKG
ncbi:unnamed protein product [Jaminaea pallidilutea]